MGSCNIKVPDHLYRRAKKEQERLRQKGINVSLFGIAADLTKGDELYDDDLLRRFRL